MKQSTVPHEWMILVLSVLLQAAAAAEYLLGTGNGSVVAERVRTLLDMILPVSIAMSVLLRFSRSARVRAMLIAFRFLAMFVAGYAVGPNVLVPALFVVSVIAEIVCYLPFWRGVTASAVVVILSAISRGTVSAWDQLLPGPSPWQFAVFVTAASSFTVFALLFRRYYELAQRRADSIQQLDRTVDALSRANQSFQKYAVDAEVRATEAERNRIVRELHDSIGYTLTNILVMSRVVRRTAEQATAGVTELMDSISKHAQDGLTEMRSTLRVLRANESDRPRGMEAIRQLANTFERSTGVRIRIESTNARWSADSPVDATIFRIVQEALTNSFRHGHAENVLLHFWQDPTGIFLNIEDDGVMTAGTAAGSEGEERSASGLGLAGMEERVRDLSGSISAVATRHGFLIRTWFPAEAIGGRA